MPQVFTGGPPFSGLAAPVIASKIIDGERPPRPQEAQGLGLTSLVWELTVRCWDQDPARRPTTTEVVRPLREWPVISPSPWNQHCDVLSAATGWLLCGLKSQISQSRFSSTGFYPFVKPRMFFRSVAPIDSSPWSQMTRRSGGER